MLRSLYSAPPLPALLGNSATKVQRKEETAKGIGDFFRIALGKLEKPIVGKPPVEL